MKNKVLVSSLRPFGIDIAGLDENAVVERKTYHPVIKLMEDEERCVIADMTTTSIDVDGDVVIPSGGDLSRFVKNPIVMWAHNYSEPCIGRALEVRSSKDTLQAKIQFAQTPRATEIWQLVKGGFLKCNSIGFIATNTLHSGNEDFKDYCKKNTVDKNCKRIITKWTLLENSIVNIPSNEDALIQAISSKSIELSDKTIKELEIKVVEEVVVPAPVKVPEEIPVIVVEPKIEVKPEVVKPPDKAKFTVVRDGDYVLPEILRQDIIKDRKEEITRISKDLRKGKIV